MKSKIVTVSSEGVGIDDALAMTEALGAECGLAKKSALRLRLLSEELLGMRRGIAGKVEANYWREGEQNNFELHMASNVKLTSEIREQLLAAASSGKNEAAKSFMGKIRFMIAGFLISAKEALPYALINTAAAYPMGGYAGESASVWSMAFYKDDLKKRMGEDPDAFAAWDELEKSIVANIADDVKVKIVGKDVEITVCKAF